MITHGDQTTYQTVANTHNNKITWRKPSYHDLAQIMARPSNCQGHGCDPTNVGPPSPNSMLVVLKHEVPLAKNQGIG